jgi:aminopeptidase N
VETSRAAGGGRLRLAFAETRPLPTYLFSFAAGRFRIEAAERGGRLFRMFHRETDADKVARNREAIFDLHAAALSWLEDYTAIAYPWGKFDFLLLPSFQFGGMEHAGAIFYNASALLLDPSATVNQKLGRASLIAHETSHMWFGDLVTMRWFDDVWMKEVFANFMAAKIVNPSFPEINHELRFLLAHYPAAYDVDRTPGTNAIRQRLDNLNEAGSLYGAIIYQKAPIVMRQLEMMLGADGLRDGLRQYLRNHAFGNASWPDLIALLDERTPEDLKTWSRAWVEERGRPIITTEMDTTDGGVTLAFRQSDPIEARGLTWSQQLDVSVASRRDMQGTPVRLHTGLRVQLNAPRVTLPLMQSGAGAPLFVLPAARGIGYGNFVLDAGSRAYLLAHLHEIGDALMRGSALVILWEEMVDGRVRPSDVLDMLARALPGEHDELNLQRMLGYTQQAYWRWIPAAERETRAAALETILRSGLAAATTQSRKSAWFAALRDAALTPATLRWLERV